uniref:cation channel sperm-associated protein 4-like isoform X1 n=1 Tax=Styela clava TaxID=7725 RepID=UPI0019394505|nr:cation channel sperm-associated protein 4-like isoform X1 [Styela clava]
MAETKVRWKSKVSNIIQKKNVLEVFNPLERSDEADEDEDDLGAGDTAIARRFCFESMEERKIRKKRQGAMLSQFAEVEVDINDITDKDDDDIAASVANMVTAVLNSVYFKGIIFFVIIINAIHIALQTVESISVPYSFLFYLVDNVIMGIFICEIVLKWYSGFAIFWKDYWNILDFGVILVLHLGSWLAFFSNTRLLRILRVIRAFRSLKTVTSLTGLSLVVETILQSIPDMANIMVLLLIFMIVLSVVGVKLFGKYVPKYFGDPIKCMFSIFVCFTQDGWMQIFRNFEKYMIEDQFTYGCACIFFIITILTAAFIIANLIVAVVTTNLDKAMKEMKEEQKTQNDPLSSQNGGDKQSSSEGKKDQSDEAKETTKDSTLPDVPILHVGEVMQRANTQTDAAYGKDVRILSQRPLYKSDLSHLTTEKLENYLLLLFALEENFTQYRILRKDLSEIIRIVRGLNEQTGDETTARLLFGKKVNNASKSSVNNDKETS